jgi:hypothetical protein
MHPVLESRLAAVIHASGILTGPIGPLAGALVWLRTGSPWMRRHLRDACIHWIIVLLFFAGAVGLDAMNPVYDFGLVRAAAFVPSITRLYGPFAWGVSAVFAALSTARALQGQAPLYPFTAWWSMPRASDVAGPVEVMELLPATEPLPQKRHPTPSMPAPPVAPTPGPPRHATDAGPESFADVIRKKDLRGTKPKKARR